jgi:hypothetical protein
MHPCESFPCDGPHRSAALPVVPEDAYAFINSGAMSCPADPGVRWANSAVVYDCGFLADVDHEVDCGGDPSTCVTRCMQAADTWNANLGGRFSFVAANGTPVGFCDTEDGHVSIGGTTTLCDGSSYGR